MDKRQEQTREEWRIKEPNGWIRSVNVRVGNEIDQAYLLDQLRDAAAKAGVSFKFPVQVEVLTWSM